MRSASGCGSGLSSSCAPNYLGVEGGYPLLFGDVCVGGVGVSGIDKDDEPVAKAGAEGFGKPKLKT